MSVPTCDVEESDAIDRAAAEAETVDGAALVDGATDLGLGLGIVRQEDMTTVKDLIESISMIPSIEKFMVDNPLDQGDDASGADVDVDIHNAFSCVTSALRRSIKIHGDGGHRE